MKIIKIITVLIIIIFVSLTSKSLLPKSNEIDDMEILKLTGLDYIEDASDENKATLSFLMEKEETGSGGNDQGSQTQNQKVITYKAMTFNEAVRSMQFYTDKSMAGSHVKYFLIGEETAKNNIDKVLDILSKDQEVRLSSYVYIIKDMTAQEFLNEVIGLEYNLSDVLDNMERNSSQKTIVKYITISEILYSKLSGKEIYLIPTLEFTDNVKNMSEVKSEEEETEELKKQFEFYGYCIMKDNKIVDFLDDKESIIYNMLINESDGGNIDVKNEKGEVASFGINDISTDYSFKFDSENNIETVVVNLSFRSNFEEVLSEEKITDENVLLKYEKLQEENIKKQVQELIAKSQELNLDIFGIGEKLKLKHPYKYRKIQDDFKKIYKTLNIKVSVNVDIERTYDTYKINK